MAPAATFVLITYNHERFVREALLSVLNQDIDDLEIVISDDASKDGTWEVICQVLSEYRGSKVIVTNRNSENIGILANFKAAIERAAADLIFCGAGDDISLPNRCSETIRFWMDSGGGADLVATDAYDMAYNGEILGVKNTADFSKWTPEMWAKKRPHFFGASHMLTKRLLNLGPLDPMLTNEDQCLVFRAMLMGGVLRLPLPLVKHRRGGVSQANNKVPKRQLGYWGRKRLWLYEAEVMERETMQMVADALLANRTAVGDGFLPLLEQYRFVIQLFSAERLVDIVTILFRTSLVPLHKRIRYARYALVCIFISERC